MQATHSNFSLVSSLMEIYPLMEQLKVHQWEFFIPSFYFPRTKTPTIYENADDLSSACSPHSTSHPFEKKNKYKTMKALWKVFSPQTLNVFQEHSGKRKTNWVGLSWSLKFIASWGLCCETFVNRVGIEDVVFLKPLKKILNLHTLKKGMFISLIKEGFGLSLKIGFKEG